jgi:hypothetical protein
MRGINITSRVQMRVTDVVQSYFVAQLLQFTVAIGHTYRAYVVAFCKKQFGSDALVVFDFFGVGADDHVGSHFGGAGTQEFGHAFYLYQAKAAGSHIGNAFQVTHLQNLDAMLLTYLQDGFPRIGLNRLSIHRDAYAAHTQSSMFG